MDKRGNYFSDFIINSPHGIFEVNEKGHYLFVNPAACQMSGYSEAELLSMGIPDLLAPGWLDAGLQHFKRVVETGKADGELLFRLRNGQERWWNITAVTLTATRFIGFCNDITDRKLAEQALRDSEMRFRALFEQSPYGIVILDPKTTLPIEFNTAVLQQLGYSREEFAQLRVSDYEAIEKPDDTRAHAQKVLDEAGDIFETQHRTREGEIRDVQVFVRAVKIAEKDALYCIYRDITDRKKSQLELETAHAKLEALWSITSLEGADIKTISDHILTTIVQMTGSNYGFYGFINEDETVMTIHAWSGEAMKDCDMVDKPINFSIHDSGIWAEAVRRRAPFKLENYNNDHAAKKGLPSGHVPLKNLLVVPHFSHGKITAVAAVANKAAGFTREDTNQITTLLTSIEAIVESKRAELAIKHSHDLMSYIIEHNRSSVAVHDRNMNYIYVSQRYLDEYKIKQTNIIGKNHYEVFPDLPQKWREVHQRALAGEVLSAEDDPYEREDGSVDWTRWECRPWYAADGSIGGIIVYTEVITERKLAEQRNLEQLEELRRWYSATLGRENRILELKSEVNQLLTKAGLPPRYPSALEGELD